LSKKKSAQVAPATDVPPAAVARAVHIAPARLINRHELLKRVPLSYVKIWALMRAGKFPRSRAVGERIFWVESEVEAWIAKLPNRPLKGDPHGRHRVVGERIDEGAP
jgi:predicted DNA-binding transcriptional regulator AlpA